MIEENEDSVQLGFEERLQKTISDLEDALLGISDEEIRQELKDKGYVTLNDELLRSFKSHLRQASFYQASERNSKRRSDRDTEDDVIADLHRENSVDFDVSISSYLKIPISDKLPSSAPYMSDIPRILPDFAYSSENSDSDLPLEELPSPENINNESNIPINEDIDIPILSEYCHSPSMADDLANSNPEFPQPSKSSKFATRRTLTTAATTHQDAMVSRRKGRHNCTNDGRSALTTSRMTMPKPIDAGYDTTEQFVRRMCNDQMKLIDRLSGQSRSIWTPTRPHCSPLLRYQQYLQFWDKFPVPGAKPRKSLRWAIRNRMAQKEELQKVSWWPEVKL